MKSFGNSTKIKSTEERRNILNQSISVYLRKGFRVSSQTDTTAQLVKPKHFSLLLALLFLILWIFPLIIYIFYYISKKDELIYIVVDNTGEVNIQT